MGPASDGERLTAAYLRQHRWKWEYEPHIGARKLDFLARTHVGPVVLEVFEPHLHLPSTGGAFDSIEPVLGLFEQRKLSQIRAAKEAGLPLILVVGSASSDVPYGLHALQGAMFGRPGVTFALDSDDPGADARWGFTGGARIQPKLNRGVSALASIGRFNPTRWQLELAWRARGLMVDNETLYRRHRDDRDGYFRCVAELGERMKAIEEELTERGVFNPHAAVARLVILHNPFAFHPLDHRFAGPHDEQHGPIEVAGGLGFTHVSSGIRCWEVRS
jgi:hypothetical protein